MKDSLLSQAEENGHSMIRVSPDRYECSGCEATIESVQTGRYNWRSVKTGIICPDARIVLTDLGQSKTGARDSDQSGQEIPV